MLVGLLKDAVYLFKANCYTTKKENSVKLVLSFSKKGSDLIETSASKGAKRRLLQKGIGIMIYKIAAFPLSKMAKNLPSLPIHLK